MYICVCVRVRVCMRVWEKWGLKGGNVKSISENLTKCEARSFFEIQKYHVLNVLSYKPNVLNVLLHNLHVLNVLLYNVLIVLLYKLNVLNVLLHKLHVLNVLLKKHNVLNVLLYKLDVLNVLLYKLGKLREDDYFHTAEESFDENYFMR